MDIILGLGIFGYALLYSSNNTELNETKLQKDRKYTITNYDNHYLNNYTVDLLENNKSIVNKKLDIEYNNSINSNSKIVNDQWRYETYKDKNKEKQINNLLTNDIEMIKNKNYLINNKIETMRNMDEEQSDSVFSDDYQSYNNVNMKMLKTQEKFMDDVISDYTRSDDQSMDAKEVKRREEIMKKVKERAINNNEECKVNRMGESRGRCNEQFLNQFDQLKFDHNGLPEGFNNVKPVINIFNNEKMVKQSQESIFNSKDDGRYGVTTDMTHGNMQPNFSSKSYGYDPEMDTRKSEIFTRNVELFTGSDQNLQFKHKKEVKKLFDPETNKVESLTGVPNYTSFFESRYIPSDKRQNERPFEPVRVTPGLNLGYNQTGSTGRQDLYRVLPKTVDELRVVTKPKVSYSQPVVPGMKGERRGVIGTMDQKTPDRFFYQSPDSMMPNTGPLEAPAIYGKYLAPQTNRAIDSNTIHINPAKDQVERNTPKYLREGQLTAPTKISYLQAGPRNIEYNTKGQIVNKEGFNNVQTQRSTTGDKIHMVGTTGNKTSVPLVNFLNYVPEITLKQLLVEDNGKKNLLNISNSLKSYLFNSINSIKDPTLRDIISDKIKIVNQKGNYDNGYLFNNKNAIPEQNMRNLSQDNIILTTISNSEKGYLFNNINSIPDPTLRELINNLWGSGGLNFDGNYKTNQMFNYKNAIPETTLKELTENLIQLTNITGPSGQIKGYLMNYINGVPDTTLKELTQDKIVLANIAPLEMKNYLLNYINSIPDTTLRELTENQKYVTGQKGNYENNYIFNYENGIPDNTLRDIIANIIQLTNFNGNYKTGYLINYLNTIPDDTIRQLTENKTQLLNITPLQMKNYMINYLNSIPDTTLKELTENKKYIIGQKGNYENNYIFNYENGIPDNTLRDIITNVIQLTNIDGNHKTGYLINYLNSIPDETLKQFTENNTNLTNITPLQVKNYIINYLNAIPDITLRELTENQKNIIGIRGNNIKGINYNYENGIPDATIREQTEKQKNIIGQKGNNNKGINYNYENGIPDATIREQTEKQKNIIGQKGNNNKGINYNYENGIPDATIREQTEKTKNLTGTTNAYLFKEYVFNYENGIPDQTNRTMSEKVKNIIGTKGNGDQTRARMDVGNALLNTEKEVIAEGRDPVPVKDNRGPTTLFTEYIFNNDDIKPRLKLSNVKPNTSIKNELFI
jgi:hypothetical protein